MTAAPDTMQLNDGSFVTVAPHHWTTVSRQFSYAPARSRIRKFLDLITFRGNEPANLMVSIRVRVPQATDFRLEILGPSVVPCGPARRVMHNMDVQD